MTWFFFSWWVWLKVCQFSLSSIVFLKIKVWPPGKTEQKLFPSPINNKETALIISFLTHKNREVVGAEAFKSEISAPKTLLVAQRWKSTHFLLQYLPYLWVYFHTACMHTSPVLTYMCSYFHVRHYFLVCVCWLIMRITNLMCAEFQRCFVHIKVTWVLFSESLKNQITQPRITTFPDAVHRLHIDGGQRKSPHNWCLGGKTKRQPPSPGYARV